VKNKNFNERKPIVLKLALLIFNFIDVCYLPAVEGVNQIMYKTAMLAGNCQLFVELAFKIIFADRSFMAPKNT